MEHNLLSSFEVVSNNESPQEKVLNNEGQRRAEDSEVERSSNSTNTDEVFGAVVIDGGRKSSKAIQTSQQSASAVSLESSVSSSQISTTRQPTTQAEQTCPAGHSPSVSVASPLQSLALASPLFPALSILMLSHNKLRRLPSQLSSLSSLTLLSACSNMLSDVDPGN